MGETLFKTTRCVVREFLSKDIERIMEYRNNLEWMKYQGFKDKSMNEYKKVLLVPFDIDKGSQLAITLLDTDELIGDLYLKKEINDIFIGYTINPKHSRKGYVYEVVNKLIGYLKDNYQDIKIKASVEIDNIPSKKLLSKLGFEFDKIIDEEEIYEYKL